MYDSDCVPLHVKLEGRLLEFRDALEAEIDQIKRNGQTSILIYGGQKIRSCGQEWWYQFTIRYAPVIPVDTPCKLLIGQERFDVTVVSFDDFSITLATKNPLSDTIGKARLENGSTVLMERLIKCIENNAAVDNKVGGHMLPSDGSVYSARRLFTYTSDDITVPDKNLLTEEQKQAIVSAISNDITYIWGPPGTGKTKVIGQIVYELNKRDRSVLIVSHTNTAVDGAIKQALKLIKDTDLLRLGTSAETELKEILLDHRVSVLGRELYERKKILQQRQTDLQRKAEGLRVLLSKINWTHETQLEQIEHMLQAIANYGESINQAREEEETIRLTIQQYRTAHPEYAKFLVLSKAVKAQKAKYDAVLEKIHQNEAAVKKLSLQIQYAQDERKKHDVYATLRAKEAEFMSASFLQEELTKISTRMTALREEIASLIAHRTTAQKVIDDYEKKSALSRFFLKKGAFAQAQAMVQDIRTHLPKVQEALARQIDMEREYRRQLNELLLVQAQLQAVIPSKTKDYWEDQLWQLQANLISARDILLSLNDQKSLLYEEICRLEQQQNQARTPFNVINELGKKLRQRKEYIERLEADCGQESGRCTEYLKKECACCAAFSYYPVEQENNLLFVELSKRLNAIRTEVATIGAETIEEELKLTNTQLADISVQMRDIQEKVLGLEKQAIMCAKIVGTTLTKSYLCDTLRERRFDTVILDEASMASIPALWCAAYLAENNMVIVGDFLQLSPIVMAHNNKVAKKWLGKDIFYHSGMQERAKRKALPFNFIMLRQQFRMMPEITEIANMYYGDYGGLEDSRNAYNRKADNIYNYDWCSKIGKNDIHMIDTESLHAWVTGVPQGKGHSRLNCFSAAIDVDIAFKLLEKRLESVASSTQQNDSGSTESDQKPCILIVAPYKPHVAQINRLIDLEWRNRGYRQPPNLIKAGTVHSFQGSEADIVIFDLVIDEPHWRANLFMQGTDVNEELRKMFNVAITRAKFKLFLVGNFAYCQKRAKNNALSELLDKLLKEKQLPKIDAGKILPNITFSPQNVASSVNEFPAKLTICTGTDFHEYLMKDLHFFQKRLIVYSPFITETRLSELLPAFVDAIRAGKKIVVITKALSDRNKKELIRYQKCEKELCDIGVSVLHKKEMHEKIIFVDSTAVWLGSLNALSFTGLTGEIMERHASKDVVAEYEKLFNIEHLQNVVDNAHEQNCPICGGELLIREGNVGGIYWQCVNKDYTRNVTQQYPNDGLLRCSCGASYVFSMENEPRWVCSKNSKHYQKIREGDLKLEKMAALVPTESAWQKLDRYFSKNVQRGELNNKNEIEKNSKRVALENKYKDDDEIEQLTLFDEYL